MEKISQGNENASQIVAEVCGVNQTTVHSYINELVNKEIIRRVKRGKYELVRHETKYDLKRSDGENTTVFIQDDGIGIFEKIKDYFKMNTIDDAICELFKGKLTTDSRNHSGYMCYHVIVKFCPKAGA